MGNVVVGNDYVTAVESFSDVHRLLFNLASTESGDCPKEITKRENTKQWLIGILGDNPYLSTRRSILEKIKIEYDNIDHDLSVFHKDIPHAMLFREPMSDRPPSCADDDAIDILRPICDESSDSLTRQEKLVWCALCKIVGIYN